MKVLGVDPGVTTGIALVEDGAFIDGREATTYDEVIDWLLEIGPNAVAIEDFIVRRNKSCVYHPSIRMIGVVEYVCLRMGTRLAIQSPSILKIMLKNTQGLSRSPHICSAAAHAFYFWRKHSC